ncbi:E3 ubiquitin-protein ligase TTC3 [Phytophthora nicotianae]|uniref:E3 ubiquitin-protein ligase TTC3 n=1 Tax=Phytophthora nicotianae TaxID=4792 RepID=A0A0W8DH45_PHYNI|nr:E3 ubiquitin-protein ligase TTC3 [Phytophthora nicotianae]
MSFLEREEDMDAMLAEALAFIDECDSDGKRVKKCTSKKPGTSSSVVPRKPQKSNKTQQRIRGRKPDSLEKNFLIALHNPSGVLKIDGFQFMRKFEESDRVVVIKHNILTLPHMGLKFRDRCWIIISRSKSDPAQASVARTCYQLYAEGAESFSSNEDVVHTRDYILSSLSGKVRRDHQMLQNLLIEEDRRRIVPMTA